MKRLLTLLIALSSYIGYSQQYTYNGNDISVAIAEYTLANTDSVSKHTPDSLITAELRFSKDGALRSVSYFKGMFTGYYDFGSEGGLTNVVTVWPGLDAFIKSQYPFVPDSRYDKENARFDVMTMTLWLDKGKLPEVIKQQKKLKKREAKLWKQMQAENPFVDVQPNAPFTLNIKKLVINDEKLPANEVKGKLMYLDSGAVRLSPECFLTFKVLKTSENGFPRNHMEYKMFVIKNGQATLYAKENRFEIDNGVAIIKVSGNREYEQEEDVGYEDGDEDDVIVVDGREYYNFGTDEGTVVSTDSFDFEIDIMFAKP